MPALVMNCFVPLIVHSPSASVARVRTLPASEPASGSVSPNAPRISPAVSLRHPLLLLLLGPEQVDRLRPERRVRAQRDRDRRVHAGELLDRDRVGQRVAPAAAVLLRERDPHQPELAELLDDRVREGLRAVQLLRDGSHLPLGEVAHRAADQLVVVGEIEVHAILIPNARYKRHCRSRRHPPRSASATTAASRSVVTTAAALFARRGFQATSMDELSEATGLRSGGLYHYIGSKQRLLFQILRPAHGPAARAGGGDRGRRRRAGGDAARARARLGRPRRGASRPHGGLRPGAPRDRGTSPSGSRSAPAATRSRPSSLGASPPSA